MEVETQMPIVDINAMEICSSNSSGICDPRPGRKPTCLYGDPTKIQAPETLDDLIKELHKVFSYDDIDADYVKALMESYRSKPKEWKKFAKFDPHRYAVMYQFIVADCKSKTYDIVYNVFAGFVYKTS